MEPGEAHLGSAEPGQAPIQVPFDVMCPLLFLNTVAKVSMPKDGGNHP
jgi:hypothetical protein